MRIFRRGKRSASYSFAEALGRSFRSDETDGGNAGRSVRRIVVFRIGKKFDCFEIPIPTDKVGQFFFRLEAVTANKTLLFIRNRDKIDCVWEFSGSDGAFMFSVTDEIDFSPKIEGGIFYQIFVDRFCRSGDAPLHPGSVLNTDWDHGIPELPTKRGGQLSNRTVFGGTLDGITNHLDHFEKLGVSCLYLTPIFDSPSNHKYDTGDYRSVDVCFGGEGALRRLIQAARQKNITILLDGVFNHTGDDSLYFNRFGHYPSLGAFQSPLSPWFSWYRFRSFPTEYESWWGMEILPKIHPDEINCREFFIGENGVVGQYMKMGIAGFRLDVADELSDSFLKDIRKAVKRENPDGCVYGEVWEDASVKTAYGKRKTYYLGDELDGVMNYPVRSAIVDFLLRRESGGLEYLFFELFPNTPTAVLNRQMNLLGSHDTPRILTVFGGSPMENAEISEQSRACLPISERKKAVEKLKIAYWILITLPGNPMIYYGDEVGLEGYADPLNRMPYPWGREDADLLSFFRSVGRFRRKTNVLERGRFRLKCLSPSLLCYERTDAADRILTVIYLGERPAEIAFSTPAADVFSGEKRSRMPLTSPSGNVFRIGLQTDYQIFLQ